MRIIAERAEWMALANCRGLDPALFHPERGDRASVDAAKSVCAQCAVREECLQFAIDTDQTLGIWGGVTRNELQAARRGRPRTVSIEHGTDRGYHAHRRVGEEPCGHCRVAHAEYKVDLSFRNGTTMNKRAS